MALIEKKNCTGEFLDDGQYSRNGILRYERIFGDTFVSTGGFQTTKVKLFSFYHIAPNLTTKVMECYATPWRLWRESRNL